MYTMRGEDNFKASVVNFIQKLITIRGLARGLAFFQVELLKHPEAAAVVVEVAVEEAGGSLTSWVSRLPYCPAPC